MSTKNLSRIVIGRTYFENIKTHLINNGLIFRLHGNIKRMPRWKTIDIIVATAMKNFLENYAEIHGLPVLVEMSITLLNRLHSCQLKYPFFQ